MTPRLTSRKEAVRASSRRVGTVPAAAGDWWRLSALSPLLLVIAVLASACLASGVLADVAVAHFAATATPQLRRIANIVSGLGDSGYMLVLSALLATLAYGLRRHVGGIGAPAMTLLGERAVFVFSTVATSGVLAQVIKHLVGRARPKLIDTVGAFHFDVFSIKADLASFPSGHTASAFGLALALGLMERRLAPGFLLLAGLVAAARVTLGSHYVSDVVAGAMLGSAVTLVLAGLFARRDVAFVEQGGRLRLKGDGLVWAALRSPRRASGQTS